MVSGTNGTFNIVGLDHGTYYLRETNVPAGYNPCADEEIVISATHSENVDGNSFTLSFNENSRMDITVINRSGLELPETGGTGTTLMYIIGGILVVFATVILVTKLKMKRN